MPDDTNIIKREFGRRAGSCSVADGEPSGVIETPFKDYAMLGHGTADRLAHAPGPRFTQDDMRHIRRATIKGVRLEVLSDFEVETHDDDCRAVLSDMDSRSSIVIGLRVVDGKPLYTAVDVSGTEAACLGESEHLPLLVGRIDAQVDRLVSLKCWKRFEGRHLKVS